MVKTLCLLLSAYRLLFPAYSPNDMTQRPAKNTFFSWLGRQVGHVKTAVKADASKDEPRVIYRNDKVEEKTVPNQPGVKLRRTTIDEVIVDPNQKKFGK